MGEREVFPIEEKRVKEKRAIKTCYMLSTPWYCNICKNKKNYTSGKWSHISTKKHQKLSNPQNIMPPNKWECAICDDGEHHLKDVFYHIKSKTHINNIHKGEWYCFICNNGKDYKCGGMEQHRRTKMHEENINNFCRGLKIKRHLKECDHI